MKRKSVIILLAMLLAAVALLSGCAHVHQWKEATCAAPQTCLDCGETKGEALPHTWADATCTAPKTCTVCGAVEGEALPHTWADATCTAPKTCTVCGATEGEVLPHTWADATCTSVKTCTVCGATEGEVLPHTWADATCTAPKTCTVCGATEGEPLDHEYGKATPAHPATCVRCGETTGEAAGLFEMISGGAKVRTINYATPLTDLLTERITAVCGDAVKSDTITVTTGDNQTVEIHVGKEEPNGIQMVVTVPGTSETVRLRYADDTLWIGDNNMLYSIKTEELTALMGELLYGAANGGTRPISDAETIEDLKNLLSWLGDADISADGNTLDVNISLHPYDRIEDIANLIVKYAAVTGDTRNTAVSQIISELRKAAVSGSLHFTLDTQSRCNDWQLNANFTAGGSYTETYIVSLSCQNRVITGSVICQSGSRQLIIPIDGYMGEKQFSLNIHDGSDDNELVFALQADWTGHFNLSLTLPTERTSLFVNGKDENGRAELAGTVSARYSNPASFSMSWEYTYDEENDLLTVTPYSAFTAGVSSGSSVTPDSVIANADTVTMTKNGTVISLRKVETSDTAFEYVLSATEPDGTRAMNSVVLSFEKAPDGFTMKQLNRTGDTAENDQTALTFTETSSDVAMEPFNTDNAIEITAEMLKMLITMAQ